MERHLAAILAADVIWVPVNTTRLTARRNSCPESKENCDRAARELNAQAILLETAGTVLARYR
jgi:hypothetical protein